MAVASLTATFRSAHIFGMFACHASRMPGMNVLGPPRSRTRGRSVLPAREDGEILQHDRVEQRRHQLGDGDALLLQAVDVGLREHAALAGDRMNANARRTAAGRRRRPGYSASPRSCR